jgi:hypothetical protein
VIDAWAVLLGSAALVAVSRTVCVELITAGAVYRPFVTVPIAGASDHVTAVLVVPVAAALNCMD